jgi:hypothetical protein
MKVLISASRSRRSTPWEIVFAITRYEAGSAPELVECNEEKNNFRPLSGIELRFLCRHPAADSLYTLFIYLFLQNLGALTI